MYFNIERYKFYFTLIFFLLIIIPKFLYAEEWTDWRQISMSQSTVSLSEAINQYMGVDNYLDVWRSDGKMKGGKKAFQVDIIKESENAKLEISHFKLPDGWIITGSKNDRKYLISVVDYFFSFKDPTPKNPIKKLNKKEIMRYRDINNRVTPYNIFNFQNQTCIAFFKEFYKADSGYIDSPEADETIKVLYCKFNEMSQDEIEIIIDSVNRK